MRSETICAISTAPGGAIGIIRVSGSDSISLVDQIFKSASGKKLEFCKGFTAHYGEIYNKDRVLDQVIVTIFRAPHSYTGEDLVEISCHGSTYILQSIINELLDSSPHIRLATAGEFTKRAFLNGKMDLAQSEAVADLIAADSKAGHDIAIKQIKGDYSIELKRLREHFLTFASLIELELDFSDHEDLEFADRSKLKILLRDIENQVTNLVHSFKLGNVIKNGVPVAIIGNTNTGKSTLLNTLLHEDRAITSEIKGTTRDTIEDIVKLQDILFRFIDTAGIRKTSDKIERIGIQRSIDKINQSSIILWVIDAKESITSLNEQAKEVVPLLKNKNFIFLFNKEDLLANNSTQKTLMEWANQLIPHANCLFISAKNKTHITDLENKLIQIVRNLQSTESNIIITNMRHYEVLKKILFTINRINDGFAHQVPSDLLAQDIRECISYLGEILGEVTSEEILHNIFSKFCIGK